MQPRNISTFSSIGDLHRAGFANKRSWDGAQQQNRWVTHVSEQQFQSGDDIPLEAHNADVMSTPRA